MSDARPEGLTYIPDFLTPDDERALIAEVEVLPFHEVRMHGVAARRTVLHFGYDYDYEGWSIHPTTPPPEWLRGLRDRCGQAASIDPSRFEQFLIARYPPGATIGWHRDAPMFGSPVIGVSLGSACRMRFRRGWVNGKRTANAETLAIVLEPRSMYILDGPARKTWQHHIPATKELRYSITMRTLAGTK